MFTLSARLFVAAVLFSAVSFPALSAPHEHDMSMHQAATSTEIYHTTGVVKKINADSVSIFHHPIAALNWPVMTMTFSLPADGKLPMLNVGQNIDFSFRQQADGYQLVSVTPLN